MAIKFMLVGIRSLLNKHWHHTIWPRLPNQFVFPKALTLLLARVHARSHRWVARRCYICVCLFIYFLWYLLRYVKIACMNATEWNSKKWVFDIYKTRKNEILDITTTKTKHWTMEGWNISEEFTSSCFERWQYYMRLMLSDGQKH